MLREASQSDFDFIFPLIIEGAKEGHYDRRIASMPAASNGMAHELMSIIVGKRRVSGEQALALVYEVDSIRVGFIVITALDGNGGFELWMAGIDPMQRRNGHGMAMLRHTVDRYKGSNVVLVARCAQESEIMFHMLQKIGFNHTGTGEKGYRGLGLLV